MTCFVKKKMSIFTDLKQNEKRLTKNKNKAIVVDFLRFHVGHSIGWLQAEGSKSWLITLRQGLRTATDTIKALLIQPYGQGIQDWWPWLSVMGLGSLHSVRVIKCTSFLRKLTWILWNNLHMHKFNKFIQPACILDTNYRQVSCPHPFRKSDTCMLWVNLCCILNKFYKKHAHWWLLMTELWKNWNVANEDDSTEKYQD